MLLIIGNGFDINLGLKTRYSDFMKYIISEKGELYNTKLFEHLLQKFNNSANKEELRWIDLENELKIFSKSNINAIYREKNSISKDINGITNAYELSSFHYALKTTEDYSQFVKQFEIDYNMLTQRLFLYIKAQVNEEVKVASQAYLLIKKLAHKDEMPSRFQNQEILKIINFNYTNNNVFKKYFDIEKGVYKSLLDEATKNAVNIGTLSLINPIYYQIHGSLEEKNIILGIEGKSNLPDEFNFLKKGFRPNYSKNCNIEKLVKGNDTIVFFGFSFGETDSPYFRQFLGSYDDNKDIHTPSDKKGFADKKIIIFHWGETGYYQLTNRINALTEGNLDRFRQYNNVEFIDLQELKVTFYEDYDKYFT